PQQWQAYAYANNTPVTMSDPTGLIGMRPDGMASRPTPSKKPAAASSPAGVPLPPAKRIANVVRSVAVKAAQAASSRVAKSVLSNLRAQNSTTPWELGQQWLTGNGPRHQEFRGGDPFTELYRLHGHTKSAVAWAQSVTSDGSFKIGHEYSWDYDLSGLDGVPKYVGDYSTLTTGGRTGNLAYTFLG